ncbi:CU044_5270 family protein [Hamadaea tsunoensis]|uniref:CU044_5270 family protein n=1 Tax=Hamadaea tsunoensis TaxID=53368 RepID=UPI000403E7F3|nr:CU044_5270 family protein [Hamadaea tsunoensis]
MEEIEIVQQMFTESPPTPATLALGRQRVVQGTRVRRRAYATPLWAAGLALGAAAVVSVVVLGGGSGTPRPQESIRLSAAQQVLTNAAFFADAQPALNSQPGQWIHYRFAGYDPKSANPVYHGEAWQRLDGRQDASLIGGRLVVTGPTAAGPEVYTPLGAWRRLAALPTEPEPMLAALSDQPDLSTDPALTPDQRAFANAGELLWNSPLGTPPEIGAALYRALAMLPGIRLDEAADVVGEPAVGLSLPGTPEILFDPATYRFLGERVVSDGVRKGRPQPPAGMSAAKLAAWRQWADDPANQQVPAAGTLISSRLRLTATVVGRPGSR